MYLIEFHIQYMNTGHWTSLRGLVEGGGGKYTDTVIINYFYLFLILYRSG